MIRGGVIFGNLHGNYNPNSQEYDDRKRLWDECGVGTDPQIGSEKEDDRREIGINGKWQATRTISMDKGYKETRMEICLRLDTLPGSVKCFRQETDEDDVIALYKGNGIYEEDEEVEIETNSPTGMSFFNSGDFPNRDRFCYLFDEG